MTRPYCPNPEERIAWLATFPDEGLTPFGWWLGRNADKVWFRVNYSLAIAAMLSLTDLHFIFQCWVALALGMFLGFASIKAAHRRAA